MLPIATMFKNNLRLLLNAFAFANVGNQSEFQRLLERLDRPGSHLPNPLSTVTRLSLARGKASFIAIDSGHNFAKR